jgi:hypothetical protein
VSPRRAVARVRAPALLPEMGRWVRDGWANRIVRTVLVTESIFGLMLSVVDLLPPVAVLPALQVTAVWICGFWGTVIVYQAGRVDVLSLRHATWVRHNPCCNGTGYADFAAVPCPNPRCTAPPRGRRVPDESTESGGTRINAENHANDPR